MRHLLLTISILLSFATAGRAAERAAADTFRCGAGEIRGVPRDDGQTAVEMVCDEIRRQSGGTGAYEISLRSLGRQIVLTGARMDLGASISLQLESIEEVSTSAARVAEALLARRPIASTQRVHNLLESETRQPLSKKGSLGFAMGVGGFSPLGHGGSGAAFSLGLTYSTPTFALPATLRFGWSGRDDRERQASFLALTVGGRHYFSTRDTSPFVGTGLSMLRVSANEGGYDWDSTGRHFDGARVGVAPYLETGVEVLRLHRARLTVSLQVDFPTGSVRSEEYVTYTVDPRSRRSVEVVIPSESRYVVPATLGVTVTF